MSEEKTEKQEVKEPTVLVVKNPMYQTEQKAPDGHVNLSKEDIKNRA